MVHLTTTNQFTFRDLLVSQIKSNSVLKFRFNIYEFEEHVKSNKVKYPYLIIPNPNSELNEWNDLKRRGQNKEFELSVEMHLEFTARDKYSKYRDEIVSVIETAIDIFEASGFHNTHVDVIAPDKIFESDKPVILGLFNVSYEGDVYR